MTEEKKPPQGADYTGSRIVLDIDDSGQVSMHTLWRGKPDSAYTTRPDDRLLAFVIPQALAELRLQDRFGRRLTVEESKEISATLLQTASGSTVTA